jgi:hypothetical protein
MAELSMLADQSGTTVEFGMSEASLAVNYGVINPRYAPYLTRCW